MGTGSGAELPLDALGCWPSKTTPGREMHLLAVPRPLASGSRSRSRREQRKRPAFLMSGKPPSGDRILMILGSNPGCFALAPWKISFPR